MSHFTYLKTSFQNLFYLEKALTKLNIDYKKQEEITKDLNLNNTNIIIPQSNGYNLEFSWNNQEYELIADLAFWQQSSPVETFIANISQEYASQVILGESQKIGFQPLEYQKNSDGSQTLVLERWNSN